MTILELFKQYDFTNSHFVFVDNHMLTSGMSLDGENSYLFSIFLKSKDVADVIVFKLVDIASLFFKSSPIKSNEIDVFRGDGELGMYFFENGVEVVVKIDRLYYHYIYDVVYQIPCDIGE